MKVTNIGTIDETMIGNQQRLNDVVSEPSKTQKAQVASSVQTVQTQNDFIELDLDSLIKLGVVERDIKIGNTIFTMRTLTEEERLSVELSIDSRITDEFQRILQAKIPFLVKSIVKINGKPISADKQEYLKTVLSKMQGSLVDMLFIEYVNLVNDQKTLLNEGVKKNS